MIQKARSGWPESGGVYRERSILYFAGMGAQGLGSGELYGVVLQYKRKPPFRDYPVR